MGNKIITEKDFWMCSSGAMPAQLQGTRKSNKKSSGDVYITVADTATSSWIDFGCTKNMLLAAILTAVAVIVVVALIVGTGGVAAIGLMGMMAIGAAAGFAGGVIAAVDGALKCGQKNATARTWDGSKDNMLLTGTPAITGDRTMTCSIGGVVKFAPEIKSWTHALALGGFNYVTQLAGCALGGAGVGAGGFLVAGLAGGSLALAAPSLPSVLSNVAGSFTGIWGGSRALFGLNSLANEHAYGNVQDAGDAGSALVNGGIPEIGMGQRIFSGQAQPSDYLLFLYLLNIRAKGPKPPVEEPNAGGDKDGSTPSDKDGNNTKKEEGNQTPEDEGANGSKGQGENKTKPKDGDEGNAYESPPKTPAEKLVEATEAKAKEIVGSQSASERGPCLSGVYDPVTGKTFYGQNFKTNATGRAAYEKWLTDPPELGGADPIIKQKVADYEAKIKSGEIKPPETADNRLAAHSEIRAYDQALKARREAGLPVDENSIREMDLHNRDLQNNAIKNNGGTPPPKVRCPHCGFLTDGINTHGHN
ncbi:hypothetical protein [Chryseobacterium sp. G0201]|uniref:hypothetical protein n=1 Tax=Chryseobacterium sp. G0201 TaxID=2487065 RepID=UPI000F4D8626|nr:hypothetical protein [Chryseobacterium sp. G0201]AZA53659.1 hypothetical protein EG348_11855 [Chryseobacterium sp. G0201]